LNLKKVLKYVLHAAVIAGIVIAAVNYLNGDEVIDALLSFNYTYAPFMVLLSAAVLLLKGLRFVPLMRPLTDLGRAVLTRGYLAGQPVTLVPGGVAGRVGIMHQVGLPASESSIAVAFAGLLDYAAYILGTVIAAIFFEQARRPATIAVGILAGLAVVIYLPVTRNLFGRASDWVADRFDAVETWREFQEDFGDIASPRVLGASLSLTIVAILLDVTILYLALRGAGTPVAIPLVFLSYMVSMMAGMLSPLPGGLGPVEAGMVGTLVSGGAIGANTGVAVVAIFRVATVLIRALLGAIVYACCWPGQYDEEAVDKDEEPVEKEEEA
jgi:uncharacterized protein (TIRG00374 family)